MLTINGDLHGPASDTLLASARARTLGNMQRMVALGARCRTHFGLSALFGRALFCNASLLGLFSLHARLLGRTPRFLVGFALLRFLLDPLLLRRSILLRSSFQAPLLLSLLLLFLAAKLSFARLFLTALGVELLLLLTSLFFEHVPLDIGAFAPHLDRDRARTALTARQPELALRLALQRNLARGCRSGILTAV